MEDIIGYMLSFGKSHVWSLPIFAKFAALNKQYHSILHSNNIYKIILSQLGMKSSNNWSLSFQQLKQAHIWKRKRCNSYSITINLLYNSVELLKDEIIYNNPTNNCLKVNKYRLIEKFQPSEGDIITTYTLSLGSSYFPNYYMMNNGMLGEFISSIIYDDSLNKYPICYWSEIIEDIIITIHSTREFGNICEPGCLYPYYIRDISNYLKYTIFSRCLINIKSAYKVRPISKNPELMEYLDSINFYYDIHTTLFIVD